jgi:hypothetical protein
MLEARSGDSAHACLFVIGWARKQATSVLATGDLKIKLGFDCLYEDRGTFGRRQASGRQAARYPSPPPPPPPTQHQMGVSV